MAATVYELYRNAKVVWVEDELSREVLTLLWGYCRLHVAVAGSRTAVSALVESAPAACRGRVFGVVDLDFTSPNRDAWDRVGVLRWTVHEAENLLLDPVVLASIAQERGVACVPGEIETELRTIASGMVPWMACRAALRELAEALVFPPDPKVGQVPDLVGAARYIRGTDAWRDSPNVWSRWARPGELELSLRSWETLYQSSLAEGAWRDCFSGKELLRGIREMGRLRLDATPRRLVRTSAERDLDLARTIAKKMLELGRVPRVVLDLRNALLAR